MSKAKIKSIGDLILKRGEITILFENQYGYQRRRKIRSNGDCFVSYFNHYSKRWLRYSKSCFILEVRKPNLNTTLKLMYMHDADAGLRPTHMMMSGKRVKL